MDLNLKGKNAIVCGSTQGIGKAIAVELAQMGASVILVARNEAKLNAVRNELDTSQGQDHNYIKADFSIPSHLKLQVEEFIKVNKLTINILINNTGGPAGGPIADAKADEFVHAFSNHLICNHILTQAVKDGMITMTKSLEELVKAGKIDASAGKEH